MQENSNGPLDLNKRKMFSRHYDAPPPVDGESEVSSMNKQKLNNKLLNLRRQKSQKIIRINTESTDSQDSATVTVLKDSKD